MNLLDKFAAVEIKADNRISESDRQFCQRRQEAYDKAGERLRAIANLMKEMEEEQKSILGNDEWRIYGFTYDSGHSVTSDDAIHAIHHRHKSFITGIVAHFSRTYSVKLDAYEICEHIIPKEPARPDHYHFGWRTLTDEEIEKARIESDAYAEKLAAYNDTITNLSLRYEAVVDEVFAQLGGFSFTEKALNELKEKCYSAVHHHDWRTNGEVEDFEIKKDTLQLTRYSCHFDPGWSTPRWSITDETKRILDAIAHYEYGNFDYGSRAFSGLFEWNIETNFFQYSWMEKMRSVKLFKNGRVDIKFASAAAVNEFVNNYLRVKVEVPND